MNSYDKNKENIIPFLWSIVHLQWLIQFLIHVITIQSIVFSKLF